jgi:arylsulfatase A-like enzyme
VLPREQEEQFAFVNELNHLALVEYPEDDQLRARIHSYELAFRMQMAVPQALDLSSESMETQRLYGIDNPATAIYGRRLLAARRLAERGVRFTLVYLSDYGEWDSHLDLQKLHARSCARVDRPLAALIQDLKRTGLDQETIVVCCTEFGRTPGLEMRDAYKMPTGRDHHPHGFTVWFAGAGIKKGIVHGATDELGFHAVEHPHYVTDIHATVLDRLGLDPRRLDVPGRKRLEIDHGTPIREILA